LGVAAIHLSPEATSPRFVTPQLAVPASRKGETDV
jgi:hypothetical protein